VAVNNLGDVAITGVSVRPHPNQATGLTGFVTIKYRRLLGLTGDAVPGAGVAGSNVPARSRFTAAGAPAIADDGTIAAKVSFAAGRTRLTGILVEGGSASTLPARCRARWHRTVTGGRFKSFSDPIIAPNRTYAFAAKLSGVPAAQAGGVWTNAITAPLHLALRQGSDAPGLGAGTLIKSIVSISLRNGELVALVTLKGAA